VAALQDGEVAQQHIVAVLQRDTLVARAGLLGNIDGVVPPRDAVGAKVRPLAVDRARAR